MPIALDGEPVDVSLEWDKDKPEATRPAFVCRYLTSRQIRDYRKAMMEWAAAADAKKPDTEVDPLWVKAVEIAVTGTKNLPAKPYNELLSEQEMWELIVKIPEAITLSESDKKKSPSKLQLSAENSATSATAGNAATHPNQAPPSS